MFSGLMLNTWIAASVVAVIAGVLGFFAVLRGSTFAAHAIPNGAFAGAAGASLLGLNPFAGLAVFFVSAPALLVSTVMTTATMMPITTTAMANARPRRRQ